MYLGCDAQLNRLGKGRLAENAQKKDAADKQHNQMYLRGNAQPVAGKHQWVDMQTKILKYVR
jgi:hypothetical protein